MFLLKEQLKAARADGDINSWLCGVAGIKKSKQETELKASSAELLNAHDRKELQY